ncbi:hypothetical protein [Microlunatus sp. GCM10028923]|uniref:hypothetical protein n=1 Tax=Microlunatus sp. GCM10028923 TaxID=3273400 RepID=UPI00360ED2C4
MMKMAARVLLRMGLGLLIISVVIRPAIRTQEGMMGDNLAIISCLVLIITALLGLRFGSDDKISKADDGRRQAAGPVDRDHRRPG